MRTEKQTSTSAKLLYRPVGITGSLVAGLVAGQVFQKAWGRASGGEGADPPKPLESEYGWGEVLLAAAAQGVVYALVKAVIARGGARAFERATGEWPGD